MSANFLFFLSSFQFQQLMYFSYAIHTQRSHWHSQTHELTQEQSSKYIAFSAVSFAVHSIKLLRMVGTKQNRKNCIVLRGRRRVVKKNAVVSPPHTPLAHPLTSKAGILLLLSQTEFVLMFAYFCLCIPHFLEIRSRFCI